MLLLLVNVLHCVKLIGIISNLSLLLFFFNGCRFWYLLCKSVYGLVFWFQSTSCFLAEFCYFLVFERVLHNMLLTGKSTSIRYDCLHFLALIAFGCVVGFVLSHCGNFPQFETLKLNLIEDFFF